jgi:formamidopyrimidine-DNA glycosylase
VPELPEVERTRLTIAAHVTGATVTGVELRRPDICESTDARGAVRPTRPADLLRGATITETRRHGKQLALIASDGRTLCIHLGMSGQVVFRHGDEPLPRTDHVHALWRVRSSSGAGTLVFRDPRRFGGLWTFPTVEALIARRWDKLGPDGLTVSAAQLGEALASTGRAVKAALLDQELVAGVGNIYADEALFACGIHPARRADRIDSERVEALAAAIRTILQRALHAGGSTLRDYVDSDGNPGSAQQLHQVYGRGGQPCNACGTLLVSTTLAQRTTVHCTRCQPRQPKRRSLKTG